MSGTLESFVGKSVLIVSCDGRCFSGTLKGKISISFYQNSKDKNFSNGKLLYFFRI